ncbi:hypothetical protein [uncultured Phenylobacterium sp.]|uniref:hypothetical protein n=1 Tax=uncultured Phenylobacterium sp. TaxID=349273 RepID=UPI0025D2C50C|nr:hypothetical protein [uncultured Phenylobacterium sp.]
MLPDLDLRSMRVAALLNTSSGGCDASPQDDLEVPLKAAAIDIEGAGDAIRLVAISAFRDWRADQTVTHARLESLEINSDDPIPAILDGERFTLRRSERVTRVRQAFYALRPSAAANLDEPQAKEARHGVV